LYNQYLSMNFQNCLHLLTLLKSLGMCSLWHDLKYTWLMWPSDLFPKTKTQGSFSLRPKLAFLGMLQFTNYFAVIVHWLHLQTITALCELQQSSRTWRVSFNFDIWRWGWGWTIKHLLGPSPWNKWESLCLIQVF
jgi:hypothetical protein